MKNVATKYCASFEHDILLNPSWYPTIVQPVISGEYDYCQGIRNRSSRGFKEMDTYDNLQRDIISEDNRFFLAHPKNGKRMVNKNVVSVHIRDGIYQSLKHSFLIYQSHNWDKLSDLLRCLVRSPIFALNICVKTRSPYPLVLYPLERLFIFAGAISK